MRGGTGNGSLWALGVIAGGADTLYILSELPTDASHYALRQSDNFSARMLHMIYVGMWSGVSADDVHPWVDRWKRIQRSNKFLIMRDWPCLLPLFLCGQLLSAKTVFARPCRFGSAVLHASRQLSAAFAGGISSLESVAVDTGSEEVWKRTHVLVMDVLLAGLLMTF